MELDRPTLDELIDILAPLMQHEEDREALLTYALIGDPTRYKIDYKGNTHTFIIRTVSYLASSNEAGFWALLESAYDQVGREQRRRIDGIRDRLNAPPKARTRYLTWRARDVDQRLRTSIHEAIFIDLSAEERRKATRPWTYQSYDYRDAPESFSTFDAAFAHYERRVLILGTPGAGKTTTLLKKAEALLADAMRDLTAPIPLLLNLSLWREEDVKKPFADWLIAQTTGLRGAGVNEQTARTWVKTGNVALLLDGLDEVAEERRAQLVQAMNAYFDEHSGMTVIVCSRVNEYEALQANEETRLWLEGAVELQTLSDDEIDTYLSHANADDLRALLRSDAALYEMAQTPLTLSMMTLAYGGLSSELISTGALSPIDRRQHLFDMYTVRMLQRKERRDKADSDYPDNHFDPEFDDYTYPVGDVNKYLGWLGIRLGEQAKTEFPLDGIYRFLENAPDESWLNAVTITNASTGLFFRLYSRFCLRPGKNKSRWQQVVRCW